MTRYRAADDVLQAEVDGEEVLLNTETGVYHLVNRTGRSLLVLMSEGSSLEDAVTTLAQQWEEDPARVAEDAGRFVAAMCERGLLQELE